MIETKSSNLTTELKKNKCWVTFNRNQDVQAAKMKTVWLIARSVPTFRPSDQCILGDLRDFLTPAMASGQSDR